MKRVNILETLTYARETKPMEARVLTILQSIVCSPVNLGRLSRIEPTVHTFAHFPHLH
jgi:hypothetical protein